MPFWQPHHNQREMIGIDWYTPADAGVALCLVERKLSTFVNVRDIETRTVRQYAILSPTPFYSLTVYFNADIHS